MADPPESEPDQVQNGGAFNTFLKKVVFLPFVQYPLLPRVPDLSDPSKFGLSNTTHLFISSPLGRAESSSRVGAWYMLPGT